MGFIHAQEFAAAADDNTLSLERAVSLHLTTNMFPPVHPDFHASALEAIEHGKRGDFTATVTLPTGKVLDTRYVLDQLHLWPFLGADSDWNE